MKTHIFLGIPLKKTEKTAIETHPTWTEDGLQIIERDKKTFLCILLAPHILPISYIQNEACKFEKKLRALLPDKIIEKDDYTLFSEQTIG